MKLPNNWTKDVVFLDSCIEQKQKEYRENIPTDQKQEIEKRLAENELIEHINKKLKEDKNYEGEDLEEDVFEKLKNKTVWKYFYFVLNYFLQLFLFLFYNYFYFFFTIIFIIDHFYFLTFTYILSQQNRDRVFNKLSKAKILKSLLGKWKKYLSRFYKIEKITKELLAKYSTEDFESYICCLEVAGYAPKTLEHV